MEPMPVIRKPVTHFRCFVIGGVVVDQKDLLVFVAARQAVEKRGVAEPIEHGTVPVVELRLIQIDGAENLLSITLAGGGNERLMSAPGPSLIETGILAETGFVSKE